MLNKRRKTIGLFAIVVTGVALLAGARLNQALGVLILGAGLAWLAGSDAASQTYDYVRTATGKTPPWLRVVIAMALGGGLLGAAALWSRFNSFVVISAMSVFGILISPIRRIPTHRGSSRATLWLVAVIAFLLAVLSASIVGHLTDQQTERLGQVAVYGLTALAVGMFWLARGRELVAAGIRPELLSEMEHAEATRNPKSTVWLYLSLFIGILILTLLLGVGLFSAFRDSAFPSATKAQTDQSNFRDILFLMLLGLWPYTCWKIILRREPNTKPYNTTRHRRVAVALGALFAIIVSLAIIFGIQDGIDRMGAAEIEQGRKDFQELAAKIASIKSRDLRTARDYIEAYEEIEPLLAEFDSRLRHFNEILVETERSVKNRGLLNIERLYGGRQQDWLSWDVKVLDVLRQDSALTKKQIDAVKQLRTLSGDYQSHFFEKKVEPLLEEENGLRQQWASLQADKPSSNR